ncbi:MAG: C40 family peptidase [Acidimicrobiaceae bacterium]|nr:C40 family peptidase [Acidimicrobiaceae bacterium]
MTHVERLGRLSTLRLASRPQKSRWILTTLAAVVVSTSAVTVLSRPAGAMTIAQEKQRAADLYNQIQRVGSQVQYLGQKYDLAHLKYAQIVNTIANTKAIVAGIQGQVVTDNARLKADAVFAYVTNGSAANSNPLFNANAANVGATDVYNQLATGNIGSVIASLKTNRVQLTQERGLLNSEMAQASAVANAAKANYQQYLTLQANIQQARSQVEGQISAYYNAIKAAAAAASVRAVTTAIAAPQPSSGAAPPPDPLGAAAVAAAESYLGVWYQWGGASRSGVDCSGLVMLAYDAVGVSLPHYSGAQFADTVRVPLWDIQPGDLLFYGYGGDEHVAMYVGGGNMIEAPQTGYQVHITPVRLGWGFAGIGRVSG